MGSMTTPTITITSTITTTTTPSTTQTTTRSTTTTQYPPLNTLMKSKGKLYVGFAVDGAQMTSSPVGNIIHTEGGFLTPPNVMSWEITEPIQGSWFFSQSDQFMNFALQTGQGVRGFPLIWHNKLPAWVKSISNKNILTSVIQSHVSTIVTRYRGYVYSWDIGTEVISDTGGMRPSVFSQVFGDYTFLDIAFRAAKAADPNARLCLNENYIDYPGAKLNEFVDLVKALKSRNVPIDCVGTETHTQVGFGGIAYFQSTLSALSSTGCEIHVTQLDIAFPSGASGTNAAILTQQRADYKTIVGACMRTPNCAGITMSTLTGGVSDRESPLTGLHPLLWDESYVKKPAYGGFVEGILGI
ncbi:hypothetical protein TWF694_002071 [Orbilia ellipsospora]|uniref:Beta-xylanase n=1 Tax=Orbilia ellipsospora TaxID=2528407 RepID=A0AAV9X5L9_9PEZI